MIGMNAVIHLITAIGLVMIFIWIQRLVQQKRLLKSFLLGAYGQITNRKVTVGSPFKATRQLARIAEIPFVGDGSSKSVPEKLDLAEAAKILFSCNPNLIEWTTESNRQTITFSIHTKNPQIESVIEEANTTKPLGKNTLFTVKERPE